MERSTGQLDASLLTDPVRGPARYSMNTIIDDQQVLAKWAREQTGRLDMAVAFWGEGAIEELGLGSGRRARVLLDLTAGGTNPHVVEVLLKSLGVQVRQLDRLHAKAYIGQTEMIIGSANASANGLGSEGSEATHWSELCLLTDCALALAQAEQWFEKKWKKSRTIKPVDLECAKAAWKNRRKTRPSYESGNILDIARSSPAELRDRSIYVTVSTLDLTDDEEKEGNAAAEKLGVDPHYFYDWKDIPLSATLISFAANGNRFSWDTPRIFLTEDKKPAGRVVIVRPGELDGYKLGPFSEWQKRLKYHREKFRADWITEEGGPCIELTEFVRITEPGMAR